jgi:predicted phage-related endonuclease
MCEMVKTIDPMHLKEVMVASEDVLRDELVRHQQEVKLIQNELAEIKKRRSELGPLQNYHQEWIEMIKKRLEKLKKK